MINNCIKTMFFALAATISCNAQQPARTYEREILDVNDLWHRFEFPVSAFAKALPTLSDVRITGITTSNDTIIAPYILETSSENTINKLVSFEKLNQTRRGDIYYYTFKAATATAINHIELDLANKNYDWKVTLEGSSDNASWFTLLDDYRIVNVTNTYTDYTFNKLHFNPASYTYYRIAIKASQAPELTNATLQLRTTTPGDYNNYAIAKTVCKQVDKNKITQILIHLDKKVPINTVAFNVATTNDFYRYYTLDYAIDSVRTDKGWQINYLQVASGVLSSREPAVIQLSTTLASQLRMTLFNGDNQPLDIKPIAVKGYKIAVIARYDQPGRYFLSYGDHALNKPLYDITQFTDRIPATITAVNLGVEREIKGKVTPATQPLFSNPWWLWCMLIGIIILLGFFTFKMLQNKAAQE